MTGGVEMALGSDLVGRLRGHVEPWGYVVIYLGWAWTFWGVVILSGESVWTFPNVVLFYVGAVSPALGGIVMIRRRSGNAGLKALWDRISNTARIGGRWYAVIFLLYPALTLLAAGIALFLGTSSTPVEPTATVERLANPLSLLAFFGFTFGAGLVEETGSTGYFLDRLIERWSPVRAGVVSGAVWASWHVPLFLMDGYYSQASYQPVVPRFFATFLFLEIIYAWIYDNTSRSVLAAILFHLMINLTGETLAPSQTVRWYTFALLAAVTVGIVVWRNHHGVGGPE